MLVKDPENPTAIRLDHSAFKHSRECWDKILASPNFANVSKADLFKLLICYPDKNWQHNVDIEEMLRKTKKELSDLRLEAELPMLEYVDIKGRKRNGKAEFIVMTRYVVETVMAFESDTYGSEKRLGQIEVKSEGLQKRTVHDIHIMQVDMGSKKLNIVKTIALDEPIALGTIVHDNRSIRH